MNYTTIFNSIKRRCIRGLKDDIDNVISLLNKDVELPVTRAVDLYLELITAKEGLKQLEFYLFNGTQIQRNYCTLFFARRNDWHLVNRAFEMGLVDKIQAYSR